MLTTCASRPRPRGLANRKLHKLAKTLARRRKVYRAELAKLECLVASRLALGERPFKTKAEARLYIGGLSSPSKMPCESWSIPAEFCHRGGQLARIPGTVCFGCYAFGNFYAMPDTIIAMLRRFERISAPLWIEAFVKILENQDYFRWFDSGDIQSIAMFEAIVEIARRCPNCYFWVPSKEYTGGPMGGGIIGEYIAKHGRDSIPANLVIRLSAFRVDQRPPEAIASRLGLVTSTVHSGPEFSCPASRQNNFCLDCRNCWKSEIPNIGYHKHGPDKAPRGGVNIKTLMAWLETRLSRNLKSDRRHATQWAETLEAIKRN